MCSALIACDKMPANGDLDGMWQIMEIEHNGIVKNVAKDQLYMSIQLKLFMLGDTVNSRRFYGYFEHKGDSMHLWQFSYASKNETDADDNIIIPEANMEQLSPWGFYSTDEKFKVVTLTKNTLELKNNLSTIRYIKF